MTRMIVTIVTPKVPPDSQESTGASGADFKERAVYESVVKRPTKFRVKLYTRYIRLLYRAPSTNLKPGKAHHCWGMPACHGASGRCASRRTCLQCRSKPCSRQRF